jgi:hypothetical protein
MALHSGQMQDSESLKTGADLVKAISLSPAPCLLHYDVRRYGSPMGRLRRKKRAIIPLVHATETSFASDFTSLLDGMHNRATPRWDAHFSKTAMLTCGADRAVAYEWLASTCRRTILGARYSTDVATRGHDILSLLAKRPRTTKKT